METNKVYLGDCLEVMKSIPDKSIDLIILDPPYNIKKDYWDYIKNYIVFMGNIFIECQRVLSDNGSFYFFHNDFLKIVELQNWLNKNSNFIFKQLIVWNKRFYGCRNKGFLDGCLYFDNSRNYQKMCEYILFYTFQDNTGLSKTMGSCVYPIREYIRSEILKAKGEINFKKINSVFGSATNGGGLASGYLSLKKEVPAFITEKNYNLLRAWLNKNKGESKYLRKEYEDLRYTYNNQKKHHSVWDYCIKEKINHSTPKPVALIENIIKHSSNEGGTILDPTAGSGTTGIACIRTKRKYILIEKENEYYDVINKRIEVELQQPTLF